MSRDAKQTLGAVVVLSTLVAACHTEPPLVEPPDVVFVRFDVASNPPIVPSPNDLAFDSARNRLAVPVYPAHTAADQALIGYLNTLDGFPVSSAATVGFEGHLDPASVNAASVLVLDVTAGNVPVEGAVRVYGDDELPDLPGRLTVRPPEAGWAPGHTFAIALLSGEGGLQGANGEPVAGTSAWLLLRSSKPLVTCEDLTSPDCRPTTDVIPSTETELDARLLDQTEKAKRLEAVRRKYVTLLDHLEATGTPRGRVALLWTFGVTSQPQVVYNPTAVPARIPSPNDLAIDPRTGLVSVSIRPDAPDAEREFLTDYLNTLKGFPGSSSLGFEVSGGTLRPESVNADSIRFFDLTPEGEALVPELAYDAAKNKVSITPPGGTWPKGRSFAVAVLAGETRGLRMADGTTIPVGSEVAALLKAGTTLTQCEDLLSPDCASTLTLSALNQDSVIRLENARRKNQGVLEALEAEGISRVEVAAVWTFTIMAEPEAVFDPVKRIVPFPTDLVRVVDENGDVRMNLPVPDAGLLEDGGVPTSVQLINNLNTLDGFSTTMTAVSENGENTGTLDHGAMSEASLDGGVGFHRLDPSSGAEPSVSACFNCTSSLLPDGGSDAHPQQLQFVLNAPLDEKTPYVGYVRSTATDLVGRAVLATPAFALLRSSAPLLDAQGKSTVFLASDEQAQQLEPVRQQLAPMFEGLIARGIPRREISLAFSSTTQTTRDLAAQFAALPAQLNVTTAVTRLESSLNAFIKTDAQNPFPYDAIGTVYFGRLSLADTLVGPGGRADLANPVIKDVPFWYATPTGNAPASGWPVVIWGHPITASRLTLLGIANSLAAAGVASIAIDLPWHGDRATCVGSKDSLALGGAASDDAACANPETQRCEPTTGRCVARTGNGGACNYLVLITGDSACFANGTGQCEADNTCEGGTFAENPDTGLPLISGWNFIQSNFFAVRDNVLQYTADVAQLVRVISATDETSLNAQLGATRAMNPNNIHFVGMSLGANAGGLAASVIPEIKRVALNAVASDLPSVLYTGLTPEGQESFRTNVAANGIFQGTPAFDQFINILRWVLDPADASNFAGPLLQGGDEEGDRALLVQSIEADPVFPNANTDKLLNALDAAAPDQVQVRRQTADETVTGSDRHGYLVTGARRETTNAQLVNASQQAQSQISTFITTGVTP